MVSIFALLGTISALAMLVAAVPLFYMTYTVRGELRVLSALLGAFALLHAGYHIGFRLGQASISVELLEPLAIVALLAFAAYYWKKGLL